MTTPTITHDSILHLHASSLLRSLKWAVSLEVGNQAYCGHFIVEKNEIRGSSVHTAVKQEAENENPLSLDALGVLLTFVTRGD